MMDDEDKVRLEELKKKKEYLELEREVSSLERSRRINRALNIISYKISVPLLVVGCLLVLGGIGEGESEAVAFGVIMIIPFLLKFISRKA